MSGIPTINIVNESSVLSDADVATAVAALQKQVSIDFKPHWGQSAKLVIADSVKSINWGLVLLDDSDQAGALGYHDLTAGGYPLGKVFAKTDLDYGYNWTITTSHELLEMLADPWIDRTVQVGSSTFYALEVADACEADMYGYDIDGVAVSDFVFPHWFSGAVHGHCDFKGHISNPHQLLSGGYIGVWTPSTGWTQKFADGAPQSRRLRLRQKKTLYRSTR